MVKNKNDHSGHGTLELDVFQEWIYKFSWFFYMLIMMQ